MPIKRSNRQIDEINSGSSDPVLVSSIAAYDQPYAVTGLDLIYVDAVQELINAAGSTAAVIVPFTNRTGFVINWQTDIIPGQTVTYSFYFGNRVEGFVYTTLPLGQPYSWTVDGSNNVLVVTFDWGTSQTGYIKF